MPEVSDVAKNLMLHLIATPERRLGRSGIQDFVNHPFFDGIAWDTIREGMVLHYQCVYVTFCNYLHNNAAMFGQMCNNCNDNVYYVAQVCEAVKQLLILFIKWTNSSKSC